MVVGVASGPVLLSLAAGAGGPRRRRLPFGARRRAFTPAAGEAARSDVASGDGGSVHLGPDVAEFLSSQGHFVVRFDSKGHLSSFTRGGTTLGTIDVPEDFAALPGARRRTDAERSRASTA
jgi:hypothetical protein